MKRIKPKNPDKKIGFIRFHPLDPLDPRSE
jgi:hypothetical protein